MRSEIMSDIINLLREQNYEHMKKYMWPPDKFELSHDMYMWFLEDVNPYEITHVVDQKTGRLVPHFMGTPVYELPSYTTTWRSIEGTDGATWSGSTGSYNITT